MALEDVPSMISLEEARALVLDAVAPMAIEDVPLLDAVGRVAAKPLTSDIDVTPFAHSAMDGYALRASELEMASNEMPVALKVVGLIGAGSVFEGTIEEGQCVRIMTGAPLPADADAVVKYEVVTTLSGDGGEGSVVAFMDPVNPGNNVRPAGEEAQAGEVVIQPGEVIGCAGVGFLASCGVTEVPTYKHPRVAIIATGSELVDANTVPGPGQIRNSNSYAMAACAQEAGAIPTMEPICADTYEGLRDAVAKAAKDYDFVITTGGAANGDFDFIKPVVDELGTLMMTTVNMRPGKAQTFGLVEGTPVFGLPGNPAAAYIGFEMLIRPALRKMQGYSTYEHPSVKARLTTDVKKKDPRRIFTRATIVRGEDGDLEVTPAKNQSSGLFGVIQRSNALVVMEEGKESKHAGDEVTCVLLDIPEGVVI